MRGALHCASILLPIRLTVQCCRYKEGGGEPDFTNYKPPFVGTLDYIWYGSWQSRSEISVESRLPIMTEEAAKEHTGLPSDQHPSDHIPIRVNFVLKTSREQQ